MEHILAEHFPAGFLRAASHHSRSVFDINAPLDGFTSLHAAAIEGQAGDWWYCLCRFRCFPGSMNAFVDFREHKLT